MLTLGTLSLPAIASASQPATSAQRGDQKPDDHRHFADHDRQVVQGWYEQHRRTPPVGLRDSDRLEPTLSAKIRVGSVLDTDLRRHVHAPPSELVRQLPAAQRGDHYYFIDGQLCLVDNHYQVEDVIRLNGR
jgi:hypothetical protein